MNVSQNVSNLMAVIPCPLMIIGLENYTVLRTNEACTEQFGVAAGATTNEIAALMQHNAERVTSISASMQLALQEETCGVLHHINVQTLTHGTAPYDIRVNYLDDQRSAVYVTLTPSAHELQRMEQQNQYFNTHSAISYSFPFSLDVKAKRMTIFDPTLEEFLPVVMDDFPKDVLHSGWLHKPDTEAYLRVVDRMYKGEPPEGEFRFLSPEGELLLYTLNYVVNRDEQGAPFEISGDFIIQSDLTVKTTAAASTPKQQTILAHQIKAHFYYNTLNTISALCKQDAMQADHAITTFASYMRSYMHLINEEENISFRQELSLVKSTLEIERLRFSDSFTYEFDLETEDFQIPPLTLQPLVENGLLHGLRRTGRSGKLTITTRKVGKGVRIIIADNRLGFDTKTLESTTSIGVKNLTKRIELMVNGTVTIQSEIGKGTQSIIDIPFAGGL